MNAGSSKLPSSAGTGTTPASTSSMTSPLDQVDVGDQRRRSGAPRGGPSGGAAGTTARAGCAGPPRRVGRTRPRTAGTGQTRSRSVTPRRGHRRAPARVGLDDLVDELELLEHDRRLTVDAAGRGRSPRRPRSRVTDTSARVRRPGRECRAAPRGPGGRQLSARTVREHLGLGRLLQGEHREPDRLAEQAGVAQHPGGGADLVGRQAVQRVPDRGRRGPAGVQIGHGVPPGRAGARRTGPRAATLTMRFRPFPDGNVITLPRHVG